MKKIIEEKNQPKTLNKLIKEMPSIKSNLFTKNNIMESGMIDDSQINTPLNSSPQLTFNIGTRNRYDRGFWQGSTKDSPVNIPDQTNILAARLKILKDPLQESNNQIEQEKNALHLYKLRRDKIKSLLISILMKLLKNPLEALYYRCNI